jgi:Tub family
VCVALKNSENHINTYTIAALFVMLYYNIATTLYTVFYCITSTEWDMDARYFVLDFYKNRVKKHSVKNFLIRDSTGELIVQFGRARAENVFVLDLQHPISPLVAFGAALANCDTNL